MTTKRPPRSGAAAKGRPSPQSGYSRENVEAMHSAAVAVFTADPIMGSADAQHECRATFVDSNKITVDVSAWAPSKFMRERTSYGVVCSNGCTPAAVADWARRVCKEYAESVKLSSRKAG